MRFLILLLALLLLNCSQHVAGGPGGQTTNGIVGMVYASGTTTPVAGVSVSLHPRSISSRASRALYQTVTDSQGRYSLEGIAVGSYLLEILQADSQGVVDSITIIEGTAIEHEPMVLAPTGSLVGSVAKYLPLYDSITISIDGISRPVTINPDGSFTITGLAAWNYQLLIETTTQGSTELTTEPFTITPGSVETLPALSPSINAAQSAAVRVFLDECGLTAVQVSDVIKLSGNTISELHLSGYSLSAIPDTLGSLTFLKELHLDSCGITSIPSSIGALTNVNTLSLKGNKLTTLPVELGSLLKLNALDISENQLKNLHVSVGNHQKLRTLMMQNNLVESLPPTIASLALLAVLNCERNRISAIPPEFEHAFANLLVFNLDYNAFDITTMTEDEKNRVTTLTKGTSWLATQEP